MWVHTDATVVISLIVTLAGGLLPSTVISAMAGLSPLPLSAVACRRWRPGTASPRRRAHRARPARSGHRRRCAPAPAAAARRACRQSVTVELAIGAPAPRTWPSSGAAMAGPARPTLKAAHAMAAGPRQAGGFRFELNALHRLLVLVFAATRAANSFHLQIDVGSSRCASVARWLDQVLHLAQPLHRFHRLQRVVVDVARIQAARPAAGKPWNPWQASSSSPCAMLHWEAGHIGCLTNNPMN